MVIQPTEGQAKQGQSVAPSSTTGEIAGNAQQNTEDGLALLSQSTAQTLQLQYALMNHNLTISPVMAAKSASDDAKKV
jgi:hypothetical protein